MTSLENLGRLVREKRGSRGVRAVAAEIGISHSTLSRVEQGHLPDLENYQKICTWLGLEVAAVTGISKISATAIPHVHFRKKKLVSPQTAHALAQMILAAQAVLSQQDIENQ
jgi:transcriptional regulator with XRE-family HTH domain